MNRHRAQAFFGIWLLAWSQLPQAAAAPSPDAVVDAVQTPAWVERYGIRQELTPGLVLQNHDRVISGPGARVRIQLADGSRVGLGADTRLDVNALGVRGKHVFTAALDVQQGALRFSTGAFLKDRQQRAVNLRIGTITAVLRGTDVWGSADAEGDRICLIEGSIAVLHTQDEAREIRDAASCYFAPQGAAPISIQPATPGQLTWWAAQTAMPAAATAAASNHGTHSDGKWAVELATPGSEEEALSIYDRARAAGYVARIKPQAMAGGGYTYAVRVNQLPTQSEAAAFAAQIAQSLQIASPVVMRY